MPVKESLLSVGIDIGTTTTQLILSRLTLEDRGGPFAVPKVGIAQREVVYRSEIHFTPLLNPTTIDAQGVRDIVAEEYRRAGIGPGDVDTGAVIITGETARKENSKKVLEALAAFAGDFVVAAAGPDLESILAAKGSGADGYSEEGNCPVLHCDIGGGTSNLALYDRGILRWTKCLEVGGRRVLVSQDGEQILGVQVPLGSDGGFSGAEKALSGSERWGLGRIRAGERPTRALLDPIVRAMAEELISTIPPHVTHVSFSGGVADTMFHKVEPWWKYGDIGPLLGEAIREGMKEKGLEPIPGNETIRATVIGAGAHSVEVSGSTIFFQNVTFPVKNVPVLRLEEGDLQRGGEGVREKLKWFADDAGLTQVALGLEGEEAPTYARVRELARQVAEGLKPLMDQGHYPIVTLRQDMGKVLGQALAMELAKGGREAGQRLLCIDGVDLGNGDYIDVGPPVAGGRVVPVVVKTLAFEKPRK